MDAQDSGDLVDLASIEGEVWVPSATRYVMRDLVGSFREPGAPQGFAVSMETPGATIPAHFHETDQFQVVVAGGGRIGRYEIAPGTAHYADADTPYGPIEAGADGLTFLTLRREGVTGAHVMPGARAEAGQRPGHAFTCRPTPGRPGAAEVGSTPCGAAAIAVRVAPGDRLPPAPAQAAGRDAYVVVVDGSAIAPDRELGVGACGYGPAGGPRLAGHAGPAGATLLHLVFARGPCARGGHR